MLEVVELSLYFNQLNQAGKGFKRLTLVQLKAENNSEKLKIEIRQILYSLYRSKKLTKTVYNNLINII